MSSPSMHMEGSAYDDSEVSCFCGHPIFVATRRTCRVGWRFKAISLPHFCALSRYRVIREDRFYYL